MLPQQIIKSNDIEFNNFSRIVKYTHFSILYYYYSCFTGVEPKENEYDH